MNDCRRHFDEGINLFFASEEEENICIGRRTSLGHTVIEFFVKQVPFKLWGVVRNHETYFYGVLIAIQKNPMTPNNLSILNHCSY